MMQFRPGGAQLLIPGVEVAQASGGSGASWITNGSALANSLVAYYRMDEASGNAIDSVAASALTDNNGVGSDTGLVYPLARKLTAASQMSLTRASTPALQMGDIDFWLMAWVNLTTKPGAGSGIFARFDDADAAKREYQLIHLVSSDRFRWGVRGGVGQTFVSTASAPTLGVNYLLVCYHDAVNNLIGISVNGGAFVTAAHTTGINISVVETAVSKHTGRTDFFANGLVGPIGVGKNYIPVSGDLSFLYNGGVGQQ